jgi:hypothetical protein
MQHYAAAGRNQRKAFPVGRMMVSFEDTAVRQKGNAMKEFIAKLSDQLLGVLKGLTVR